MRARGAALALSLALSACTLVLTSTPVGAKPAGADHAKPPKHAEAKTDHCARLDDHLAKISAKRTKQLTKHAAALARERTKPHPDSAAWVAREQAKLERHLAHIEAELARAKARCVI